MILLKLFKLAHPQRAACIARHSPVPARRQGDRTDFWAVRQAGALELLCEKAVVKHLQPLQNFAARICPFKRIAGEGEHLGGCKSPAYDVVQEKVMQFVRTDNALCFLCDLAFIRRQEFGTCLLYTSRCV